MRSAAALVWRLPHRDPAWAVRAQAAGRLCWAPLPHHYLCMGLCFWQPHFNDEMPRRNTMNYRAVRRGWGSLRTGLGFFFSLAAAGSYNPWPSSRPTQTAEFLIRTPVSLQEIPFKWENPNWLHGCRSLSTPAVLNAGGKAGVTPACIAASPGPALHTNTSVSRGFCTLFLRGKKALITQSDDMLFPSGIMTPLCGASPWSCQKWAVLITWQIESLLPHYLYFSPGPLLSVFSLLE